jgi:hypothetical protein
LCAFSRGREIPLTPWGKLLEFAFCAVICRTLCNTWMKMWLNSHMSEQTRDFNALITDPWVASGLWPGQIATVRVKLAVLLNSGRFARVFCQVAGEKARVCGSPAGQVNENGAAINALFTGAGAGSAATTLRRKA